MRRHAYFDLDGTLTDPFEGIAKSIAYALDRLGEPVPDDAALRGWIGPPLLSSFENCLGAARADRALILYRERFGASGWRENRLYDGIEAALSELVANGWRLFVATSKPTLYADRIVEHFGLGGLFQRVFGSELDGTRTGKTELLAFAMQQSGPASLSVMVGDRRHDIAGALDNGMVPYGAAWGFGSIEELESAGATSVIARPSDIPSQLAGCKLIS